MQSHLPMWMMSSRRVSILSCLAILIPLINAQFTLDACRCDAECAEPRVCIYFTPPFNIRRCEAGDERCQCAFGTGPPLLVSCTFQSDCPPGDVCVGNPNTQVDNCISECRSEDNCPPLPDESVCDPPAPVITPKPSKSPRPSRTPPPSKTPSPSATPRPSKAPKPTGPEPGTIAGGLTVLPSDDPSESPLESPNFDMEESLAPVITPEPTKTPRKRDGKRTGRLTGDSCAENLDCRRPRKCYTVGTADPCDPPESCECRPRTPQPCEIDEDCVEGEQCSDTSGQSRCVSSCSIYKTEDPERFDASCESEDTQSQSETTPSPAPTLEAPSLEPTTPPESPTPTPSPTEAICVAAEELQGVEKVFEKDLHAWVLCDARGSCATPGHMVMWNGVGMMMKTYCDVVGCEKKVMAVNSPRWRAGVVRAKTNGLGYTSFAARFETRAEERVLAAVVRLVI